MKKLITATPFLLTLLFCGFLLVACDTQTSAGSGTTTSETAQPIPPSEARSNEQKSEDNSSELDATLQGHQSTWKGQINQKIPVTLEIGFQEDIVYGSLVYDKVGTPIQIIGQTYTQPGDELPTTLELYEFDPQGVITGTWSLQLKEKAASGTWFNPNTRTAMPAEINMTANQEGTTDLSAKDITGSYYYAVGESGGNGSFDVLTENGDDLTFELLCVTAPPATHIAQLEEMEGEVKDNVLKVRMQEDQFIDCAFNVRFFKDFLVIDYVEEKTQCGFGHNAFVNGIYLKTK